MTDPTTRDNPVEFWAGYGAYREGRHYTKCTPVGKPAAWYEGWYYAMVEGKAGKPLYQSRSFYNGLAVIGVALWGFLNKDAMAANPEIVASITAALGAVGVVLRAITKSPIR